MSNRRLAHGWLLAAVLAVLIPVGPSRAGEPPDKPVAPARPMTPELAADKVTAAWKTEDGAALAALAEQDNPDPWLVADELLLRSEDEAALAFAKAAPRPDTEKLPGYVVSREGIEENRAAREALDEAMKALEAGDPKAALAALETVGHGPAGLLSVRLLEARGHALRSLRRLEASAGAFHRAAAKAGGLGWLAAAARAHHEGGVSAWYRSDHRTVLLEWETRLALEEERRSRAGVASTLENIGNIHYRLGDYQKALDHQERALNVWRELGSRAGVASTLGNIGNVHESLGDFQKALDFQERALKLCEELGDRFEVGRTLSNMGSIQEALGDYGKALDFQERALTLMEELGNRVGVAVTLGNIGNIHHSLGDYPKALDFQERAQKLCEELGDRDGVARALGNIGNIHYSLGDYPKALDFQERALMLKEVMGNRPGMATTLGNIGNIRHSLGDYPKALDFLERALKLCGELGDRAGVARALANIGLIHHSLGDYPKALESQGRVLKLMQEMGDRAGMASTLGNIGNLRQSLGDYPRALDFYGRSLKLQEELGNRAGVAITLGNIGSIHYSLGNYPKALDFYERSLKLREELGNRVGVASTLGNIGKIHSRLGDYPKALDFQERALRMAREAGASETVLCALGRIAGIHLALDDPGKALAAARSMVRGLGAIAGGLAEEQGAGIRERFGDVFDIGVLAGVKCGDPAEVSFFLESGRAGSLLEFLGGREKLQAFLVPEELRAEMAGARAAESGATHLLTRALEEGHLKKIRQHRTALDRAREDVREVVQRIQRMAKASADVLYPEAASLVKVRGVLRKGEALVLYALTKTQALALVVTSGEGRIVSLGETAKIREAVEAVSLTNPEEGPSRKALEELRKLVLAPLGLGPETTRLLVSPQGALSEVPFAVLLDREVVYVPSGTTYALLMEEKPSAGKGVLALGDPDYGVRIDPRAVAVMRGGATLTHLPATRKEAKAVGDVVLLGKAATERGFIEAVRSRSRWRAIHLACHGLIDRERPTLSSLAFTPDGEDDGFLTCLDVFRMKIPADLVVLSACETARGKVYRAEGIVGFTRAFMMAGSPRVVCSLWKVDDEATQALMVKFYDLWNPGEGKGMGAAAALREAQAFIRNHPGHPEWKHPYYWAAWVLWGLPE